MNYPSNLYVEIKASMYIIGACFGMGSGPISKQAINDFIILCLHPNKSEMGPDPINIQIKLVPETINSSTLQTTI